MLGYPGIARKFEKKKFVFNFRSLNELLSPKVFALDGCFSREKPYHDQGESLVWTGPQWMGLWRLLKQSIRFGKRGPLENGSFQKSPFSNVVSQPKEEVLGWISLLTSGQKLRSGPPNPGKRGILARTSCADIHEKTSV